MSQDISRFLTGSCDLLAFGEPTHGEPAFAQVRNEVFTQLVDHGFRSISLETDRVAALTVNDFVERGAGTLDTVMSEGFSHGLGNSVANRQLVAWMRDYNESQPSHDRLCFHGFDAPMEMTRAPSPRCYLENACDYLDLNLDIAGIAGDDERWNSAEAVMDHSMSIGATADAAQLRSLADDMALTLYARAPELVAATSLDAWRSAEVHLTAGLGLLSYHKESAQASERSRRIGRMLAIRDVLMAHNLLAIRGVESRRGPTLVFAHNRHLQRNQSHWRLADMDLNWFSAGAIVGSLVGQQYVVIVGSLGRSESLGLPEPRPDTYEGLLQRRFPTWGLTRADTLASSGPTRSDTQPEQGYFPLDHATIDAADAVLHIDAAVISGSPSSEGNRG